MVTGTAVVSVLSVAGWALQAGIGVMPPTEHRTGEAIGRASQPGDTIVVHGGRADVVLASGLESPYPYLWSLPMRVHDPGLDRLAELLASDEAPTWVVEMAPFGSWSIDVEELERVLAENYVRHATTCRDRVVHLHRSVDRPEPEADCESGLDVAGRQEPARRIAQASSRA